jgi:hypothetical protein
MPEKILERPYQVTFVRSLLQKYYFLISPGIYVYPDTRYGAYKVYCMIVQERIFLKVVKY